MPGGLDPGGPVADEIAELWWLMLWLGLAVFILFLSVLAAALFRRRRERPGDDLSSTETGAEASAPYVRRWIFGLGVVMTTAVLVVVLVLTVVSMRAIPTEAGAGALRLDLVAHQWHWEIRYPDGGPTTRNTVRIPVRRSVELRLASADVIHSFWVPALAGKMDAVPGRTNTLVLEASRPGTFRGQCAEFCGLHHAQMRVIVIAMEPAAFARWLEQAG